MNIHCIAENKDCTLQHKCKYAQVLPLRVYNMDWHLFPVVFRLRRIKGTHAHIFDSYKQDALTPSHRS